MIKATGSKLMLRLLTIAIGSLAISLMTRWEATRVPKRTQALAPLYAEPLQTTNIRPAFTVEREGHRYQIEPVAEYELAGLVVSVHDAKSIWDISHAGWGDSLNTKDLCVLWGKNLDQNLSAFRFWSGDWTCYFQTNDAQAFQNFNLDQISNNHLIPAHATVAKAIRDAEVGDQIKLRGQLANYGIDGQPGRKTSLVRTDREDGACETIFVTDFSILKRANGIWIYLSRFTWNLFLFAGVVFLVGAAKAIFLNQPRPEPTPSPSADQTPSSSESS